MNLTLIILVFLMVFAIAGLALYVGVIVGRRFCTCLCLAAGSIGAKPSPASRSMSACSTSRRNSVNKSRAC